ncbi:MAG: hypothetical protein AB4050_12850 [Synechococcus sp.]
MELLEQQVSELQQQVDLLRVEIERLPTLVASELSTKAAVPARSHATTYGYGAEGDSVEGILLDESLSAERNARAAANQDMPPEAQVQRLTAQLTAAYNRIAALEEQLLSQRLQ